MKSLQDLDWETILDYLETEQAALFIGPEIAHFDGEPMNLAWRKNLWETFRNKIAYFYEQDGLFLFPDKIVKNNASNYVRKFLNERSPDESVYVKIAQIKFPLIVSINPDTYLSDTAFKYGIPHRFSYFKSRSKAVADVETPQKEQALFYNLCGTVNDDESIILDYEDLFRLIASSVSAPGIPANLQAALAKVRIFFFLGFQFEKWYTQLLLRLLCGQDASEKYAANQQRVNNDVGSFLLHQFQIEFIEQGQSFLDVLHAKCANRNLLHPLAPPASPEKVKIMRLMQTAKDLYGPLDELMKQSRQTPAETEATLLVARYHNLMEERKKGLLDSRDYFIQYNRILDAVLTVIHRALV